MQGASLIDPFSRRSEEALRHHPTVQHETCALTAARRASSWGDNPTDFMEEVASLNSEEPDLDDKDMILGAGGICNDLSFVTPGPQGIPIEQATSRQPQPMRTFGYGSPPLMDATMRGHGFLRYPHSASPLAQVAYESESSPGDDQEDDDDFDEMYSSSLEDFDEPQEGEDSDEDEDVAPIEFRRRLPASPPPQSESSGDEPS